MAKLIKRKLLRVLDGYLAEYYETYASGITRVVTISYLWDDNAKSLERS